MIHWWKAHQERTQKSFNGMLGVCTLVTTVFLEFIHKDVKKLAQNDRPPKPDPIYWEKTAATSKKKKNPKKDTNTDILAEKNGVFWS